VVKKWENHDYAPDKMKVFLTNGPVNPPKKTMNALYAHVYIVLVSFALVYAYRVYNSRGKDKDAELSPTEEDLKGEDEPSRETFYAKGVGDWG
jgi:hypothetical protein